MRSYVILLVEDNPNDVKLTLRAFARNNIANEVVVARDGAEALDYLFGEGRYAGRDSSVQPGLVLLDLKLPRVTGLQVLARMRADDRTRDLPVVILTSSSEERDVAASYAAGANNYMRKPVHFASFLNAVRSVGLFWTLVESGLALLHPEIDDSAAPPSPGTPAGPPAGAAQVGSRPAPLEVLLGVADPIACAHLAEALVADGNVVHLAHAALGTFARLFQRLPDVLVVDRDLPDIAGTDVIRTLRGSPAGRAVAAVLLTPDREGSRAELADEEIHLLDGAPGPRAVVTLVHDIRLATLLRELATERERVDRAALRTDPWGLLDLPASAPAAAIAHAVQTLSDALEEEAAQAPSAYVRVQSAALAARVRTAAGELAASFPTLRSPPFLPSPAPPAAVSP